MSDNTHLDDIIKFKDNVLLKISSSQDVVGLILNNPDIDMDSDDALNIIDTNMYSYDYLDDTVERSDVFVMVDCDAVKRLSGSILNYELYVQVVCGKSYMPLDGSVFRGVAGDRLDNVVRHIDVMLNNSKEFGIGRLELKSVLTASTPPKFSSKMLTYSVVDFALDRGRAR